MNDTKPAYKLRIRRRGDTAELRLLLAHPMETGARKDTVTGARIARHYIRELRIRRNGAEIFSADWNWGIAADPYLALELRKASDRDRIELEWTDDRGHVEHGIQTLS
ncbi:MAG: thiosulfate oxidation carrier complex protein SoxZ [Chromatiales bacterium]|nr:thiosulfate oxidation carrier complex protein SoxZ [Chromatiales bacterium]